tara:strand:- start:6068 stop:6481 length:414 start_codon:yes stop_codon:yes gene_type:complete
MPGKLKNKKYVKGGKTIGPSHKNGGIDINVEGGEYIIRKDSVNNKTLPVLKEINKTGEIPKFDAGGRVTKEYAGGGKTGYSEIGIYKDGGLTSKQKKQMKAHKEHHTSEHMKMMKKEMIDGASFNAAHKKTMGKIGK